MIKNFFVTVFWAVIFTTNASANEDSRISRLEQDVQILKQKVSQLELTSSSTTDSSKVQLNSDGWKSLPNWRLLTTGMTPASVRKILGEPNRVNGGEIATWYYQNRGYVTFMNEKLYSWGEPR